MTIRRKGKVWEQTYHHGVPQAPMAPIGETTSTGTRIHLNRRQKPRQYPVQLGNFG